MRPGSKRVYMYAGAWIEWRGLWPLIRKRYGVEFVLMFAEVRRNAARLISMVAFLGGFARLTDRLYTDG